MRNRGTYGAVAGGLAAVGLGGILFLTLRGGSGPPAPDPGSAPGTVPAGSPIGKASPPATGAGNAGSAAAPGEPATSPLDALRAALESGDAAATRAAAAALRRSLRTDPEALRRAAAVLLDPATGADLRAALALVLGTVDRPAVDPALREALGRFSTDAVFARCALLALGAAREPEEDDEVFDLGDRPWGMTGPGGLGITVRRRVDDPESRAILSAFLGRPESPLRGAAAAALRHTVSEPGVRDAFLAALAGERDDGVAPILGESLAGLAGATADGGERSRLVAALLARAGDEGLDGYRFRMENDFQRIALDAEGVAALEELASDARPLGTRTFALTALVGAASRSGPGATARARALLEGLVAGDGQDPVRDLSARLLGTLPASASSAAALARAAREDRAWNVRFTALEALARGGGADGTLEILRAARSDPDPRVADRARELLERLSAPDYGK